MYMLTRRESRVLLPQAELARAPSDIYSTTVSLPVLTKAEIPCPPSGIYSATVPPPVSTQAELARYNKFRTDLSTAPPLKKETDNTKGGVAGVAPAVAPAAAPVAEEEGEDLYE